jgi:predicted RNA binding protein YcfA (HicA-like mRNA interferase family)
MACLDYRLLLRSSQREGVSTHHCHGDRYGARHMPRAPRVTGRDIVRALGRCGWVVVVQRGSHAQLKHPDRGGRVTVPLHAGETIGPNLLRSILHQAELTMDEFLSVL